MPLRLKWGKKSGRYDLSQDIYVLSVFVGDHLLVQCTLTSESTAHQCVLFLKEKVDLTQVGLTDGFVNMFLCCRHNFLASGTMCKFWAIWVLINFQIVENVRIQTSDGCDGLKWTSRCDDNLR